MKDSVCLCAVSLTDFRIITLYKTCVPPLGLVAV